jgi:hypothetical protein
MTSSSAPTLWYRQAPGNGDLVFAEPGTAQYIDTINCALRASTWGEFRKLMPEEEYEEIVSSQYEYIGEPELVPSNEDTFDSAIVPGYHDGDYPPWLQKDMEDVLPENIAKEYGTIVSTVLNGNYLSLPTEYEHQIVDSLKKQGYIVKRRDDLSFS